MAEDPLTVHARARVGRVLRGKWTLDRLIGVGGMAAVYEATHRNGSKVAIKMLHPNLMFETNFAHRLIQEGYVANKINHPAAVKIYDDDADETDGSVFLVMELLEGQTLSQFRRSRRRFPELEVMKMMSPVLECLGSAHQKGIVHRDIKPENLFVDREGTVRVLDFGIARVSDSTNVAATRTGMVVGSPAYMAPEQALGKMNSVGPQTDVYAVGATMFALLSGTTPHPGESTQEMIVLVATQAARKLESVLPEVHPQVAALVNRALSYDRDARFPDAMAMLMDVRAAINSLEGGSAPAVLPTFAEEDDDEGETRVSPAVRAAGAANASAAAPRAPSNPAPPTPNTSAPRPQMPTGNPLAAKLRAPTMAPPTGAQGLPPTQAIEAFPMGNLGGPPSMPGPSPQSPPPGAVSHGSSPGFVPPGPAGITGSSPALAMPPLAPPGSSSGINPAVPEPGTTSGQRPGVTTGSTTGMTWAAPPNTTGENPPARPRGKGVVIAVAAALALVAGGLGLHAALSNDAPTPTPTPRVVTQPVRPTPPPTPPAQPEANPPAPENPAAPSEPAAPTEPAANPATPTEPAPAPTAAQAGDPAPTPAEPAPAPTAAPSEPTNHHATEPAAPPPERRSSSHRRRNSDSSSSSSSSSASSQHGSARETTPAAPRPRRPRPRTNDPLGY
ncbi:MAG: protein kinase [Polyangiales bacterium]